MQIKGGFDDAFKRTLDIHTFNLTELKDSTGFSRINGVCSMKTPQIDRDEWMIVSIDSIDVTIFYILAAFMTISIFHHSMTLPNEICNYKWEDFRDF